MVNKLFFAPTFLFKSSTKTAQIPVSILAMDYYIKKRCHHMLVQVLIYYQKTNYPTKSNFFTLSYTASISSFSSFGSIPSISKSWKARP